MELPMGAERIMQALEDAGYEAYAVGGCVRDSILGRTPKDYDLCTNASPEQMRAVFADWRVVETGIAHGTLTVLCDKQPYEVTTYRVDGAYADHRHPQGVTFVRDLTQDLSRRDFTVNAMAYHPKVGVVDVFGGQADLREKKIRCVGQPQRRFAEDALRILRALRFASVYNFTVEAETARAARDLRESLRFVARERVTAELEKLLCGAAAERILLQFPDVLGEVLPLDLAAAAPGVQARSAETAVRLTYLLRGCEDVSAVLQGLRLDKETEMAVRQLTAQTACAQPVNRPQVRRLLSQLGKTRTKQLYDLHLWPQAPLEQVLNEGDCVSLKELALTGDDLRAAGVPAGREIGRLLHALLEAVMCDQVQNTKPALLSALQPLREEKNPEERS